MNTINTLSTTHSTTMNTTTAKLKQLLALTLLLTQTLTATPSSAQSLAPITNYSYDAAGQLTQITQPDGSTLRYTYDNAHRLTAIIDTLGNSIVYTLDAMGNRPAEPTRDPAGTLQRNLTRSIDALNRVQKQTGVQ